MLSSDLTHSFWGLTAHTLAVSTIFCSQNCHRRVRRESVFATVAPPLRRQKTIAFALPPQPLADETLSNKAQEECQQPESDADNSCLCVSPRAAPLACATPRLTTPRRAQLRCAELTAAGVPRGGGVRNDASQLPRGHRRSSTEHVNMTV
ncbi:hypothetical protein AALO_G00069330 [Alosa alosa]|uniref:Uncharacterized protein n=1 Tax=Alosa alosa TaxID=278164 RepID=A0AAV6H1P9_9TELE|nr:hypothetical protein AALO_G00069330 [Alosa alosa]